MKIIISLLVSLFTLNAFALECFEFKFKDFPDSSPINSKLLKKEIWCYQQVNSEKVQTIIFNFDGKKITENLGILVSENGNFLFFDRLYGKGRVVEQIGSSFNPYQIPLSIKDARRAQDAEKVQIILTVEHETEIEKMIYKMINSKKKIIDFSNKPGLDFIDSEIQDEEVYLPADKLPSDGYWWPFRSVPMANPEDSPTKIYDLYVKTKTGKDPKATEWEQANHSLQNVYWGGHCNGWVASAILDGFYDKSLIFNPGTGRQSIIIEPSKIQGMRTEAGFCVKFAFYGNRYQRMGDDLKDITPELFHKTIKYYLKELGKPLALDRISNETVDNSIFSGYKITVDQEGPNKYFITAKLRTHYYSYAPVNSKKVATTKEIQYQYYLFTDNTGAIIRGQWERNSPNPDFLWAPLEQMKCGRENPNMDPKYIDEMIQTLPKAP
jgi:hypothetical protein